MCIEKASLADVFNIVLEVDTKKLYYGKKIICKMYYSFFSKSKRFLNHFKIIMKKYISQNCQNADAMQNVPNNAGSEYILVLQRMLDILIRTRQHWNLRLGLFNISWFLIIK